MKITHMAAFTSKDIIVSVC